MGNLFLKKRNRGTTMAEVLVGFTLLAILMAGVSRIVSVSVNMFMETKDVQNRQAEFQENYYKKNPDGLEQTTVIDAGKLRLVQTDSDGKPEKDGIVIELSQMQAEKITDTRNGIFVYRFSHKN